MLLGKMISISDAVLWQNIYKTHFNLYALPQCTYEVSFIYD